MFPFVSLVGHYHIPRPISNSFYWGSGPYLGAQHIHLLFSLSSAAQRLRRPCKTPALDAPGSETSRPGSPCSGLISSYHKAPCSAVVRLYIQVALSRYCPQVLPGGTLVPGPGCVPAGCFPACGHQTTYTVSPEQMPYTLGVGVKLFPCSPKLSTGTLTCLLYEHKHSLSSL